MRSHVNLCVALMVLVLVASPAARADVVINELMADPASDWSPSDGNEEYGSVEDEWLEIHNTGFYPVDVTGWRLRDAVSDSSWRYAFDGVIGPGEFRVVYGNEAYDWEDANGYPRYGLSLNNGGDAVTLVSDDLATVVDAVVYGGDDTRDDCSFGRFPDGTPDWCLLDGLNPLDPPATGLEPSPGGPNICSPVTSETWGVIKALYR
jgi:hypothetical protein